MLAYQQGAHAAARAHLEESAALERRLGDGAGLARSLGGLARVAQRQGEPAPRVRGWHEEGVTAARRAGDAHALAFALAGLGLALGPDEPARARALLGESLALFREAGDAWFSSVSMNALAGVLRAAGAPAEARPLYEAALAIRRAAGDRHGAAIVLHNLGQLALLAGDSGRAAACFREGLALARAVGDRHCLAWCLAGQAGAVAPGQPARAARLLGAAAPHLAAGTTSLHPPDPAARDRTLATVRRALGGAAFAAAWAAGQALSVEQAAARALTTGAGGPATDAALGVDASTEIAGDYVGIER
jgi:hypothetical protein